MNMCIRIAIVNNLENKLGQPPLDQVSSLLPARTLLKSVEALEPHRTGVATAPRVGTVLTEVLLQHS